jgi:hypothetical protein
MRSNPDESWGEASPDTPRQPPDPIGPDPVPPPDPRDPPPYPRYVDVPPTQPIDDGRVVVAAGGGAS